jgi:hypothetical protein
VIPVTHSGDSVEEPKHLDQPVIFDL